MAVLIFPVVCAHPWCLLRVHTTVCGLMAGKACLRLAHPPHHSPPPPTPFFISDTRDITGVVHSRVSYETVSISLLYLLYIANLAWQNLWLQNLWKWWQTQNCYSSICWESCDIGNLKYDMKKQIGHNIYDLQAPVNKLQMKEGTAFTYRN